MLLKILIIWLAVSAVVAAFLCLMFYRFAKRRELRPDQVKALEKIIAAPVAPEAHVHGVSKPANEKIVLLISSRNGKHKPKNRNRK